MIEISVANKQERIAQMPTLTDRERYALAYETLCCGVFPRRCPFCGRVIGFLPDCDLPSCHQARAAHSLAVKRLDPEKHYFGEISGAAAVYTYEGAPRDAILRLKYRKMYRAGRTLGNIMAKELFGCTFLRKYGIVIPAKMEMMAGYHVIVPVPPSDGTRGYNPPTLLAQALHHALGVPLQEDALARVRFTKRQAGLPFEERFANVAGAFAPTQGLDLIGKRVLLVDDVITTGSTVCACAQALYHAGAEDVFAVSFAEASKPEK